MSAMSSALRPARSSSLMAGTPQRHPLLLLPGLVGRPQAPREREAKA